MRKAIAGVMVCFAAVGAAGGMASIEANAQPRRTQNAVVVLDHGWQFRQAPKGGGPDDNGWLPATVPGDVQLDLLANKQIPDPFYRDNEARLQWIENESWEYRLDFDVTPELLGRANVDLVFDGLDAVAQVYVNDAQVLNADNGFRTWRVPVKANLHAGTNQLRVIFPSPIKAAEKVAAADPWQLRTKTAEKTYIRKAAYEYGWDWGPKFVTSGIWRPVQIEAWDKVRIAGFAIRQRDVSREVAHLDAEVEVEASSPGPAQLKVKYLDNSKPVTLSTNAIVHAGSNVIEMPVEIRQPKLWYPAGYGDQPIYEFTRKPDRTQGTATSARSKPDCAPFSSSRTRPMGPHF